MTRRTRRTRASRSVRALAAAPLLLLFVLLLIVLSFTNGLGRVRAGSAPPPMTVAELLQASAGDGASLFQAQCSACHTIGGGDGVGPDLQGVTTRREADWLSRWILDPAAMISDGDPIATELLQEFNNLAMPALGLSEADVASLMAFLTEQDGGGAAPVTPQPIAAAPGESSAATGKNLFTGATRLSNGGPSCRACHSTAGIGGLGGGKLGPDLTGAFAKLGDAMILWPETTPPMQPIYSSKPLTGEEKAALLAFFSSTDVTQRSTEVIGQLIGLAVVGVVVLGILAQLIWRRRLSAVRAPMVSKQRAGD